MKRGQSAMWLLAVLLAGASQAQDHGQINEVAQGEPRAWDANGSEWLAIEAFWERYARSGEGFHWGRGTTYPAYAKLKEHDTLVIEVAQGPCLMEFFHQRWRRANDVRRWDDRMNTYGGCAHVLDGD